MISYGAVIAIAILRLECMGKELVIMITVDGMVSVNITIYDSGGLGFGVFTRLRDSEYTVLLVRLDDRIESLFHLPFQNTGWL